MNIKIRPIGRTVLLSMLLLAGGPRYAAAQGDLAHRPVGGAAIWERVQGPLTPSKSDWEIEREVRSELFANPLVKSRDIDVTVVDGVARLTGSVESRAERDAAERSALEAGARRVDNGLAIVRGPGTYTPRPSTSDPDGDSL